MYRNTVIQERTEGVNNNPLIEEGKSFLEESVRIWSYGAQPAVLERGRINTEAVWPTLREK